MCIFYSYIYICAFLIGFRIKTTGNRYVIRFIQSLNVWKTCTAWLEYLLSILLQCIYFCYYGQYSWQNWHKTLADLHQFVSYSVLSHYKSTQFSFVLKPNWLFSNKWMTWEIQTVIIIKLSKFKQQWPSLSKCQ